MRIVNLLIVTGLAAIALLLCSPAERQRRYRLAGGPAAPEDDAKQSGWDAVDEASAESFPASDPSAKY